MKIADSIGDTKTLALLKGSKDGNGPWPLKCEYGVGLK